MSTQVVVATGVGGSNLDGVDRALGTHGAILTARLAILIVAALGALAGTPVVGLLLYIPMMLLGLQSAVAVGKLAAKAPPGRARVEARRARALAVVALVVDAIAPWVAGSLIAELIRDLPCPFPCMSSRDIAPVIADLGTVVVGVLFIYVIASIAVTRSLRALAAFVGDTALVDSVDRLNKLTVATLLLLVLVGSIQALPAVNELLWLVAIPPVLIVALWYLTVIVQARARVIAWGHRRTPISREARAQ